MRRTSNEPITGWAAILLLPLAIPLGLVAQIWPGKRTVDRTAEDVAGFVRDFVEGTGGEWDWDEFESVPITDPELDGLRMRAAGAGPPNAELAVLREVLAAAEAIALRHR